MKKHPDYNKPRPYNDRIVEIHERHGLTRFTHDAQFWTLGGPKHYEYHRLAQRLTFAPRSYHTVDRGGMDPIDAPEVVAYPNTEFMDIYRLWHNPIALSYDSTELLTSAVRNRRTDDTAHDRKIITLAQLAIAAMQSTKHPKIAVHANYMVSYPATKPDNVVFFKDDYVRWASLFTAWLADYDVEAIGGASETMEGSRTEMVDLHFIISRK